MATGFLRNSLVNEEGGVDPEQFRMEAMFDRVDSIGKSMLGLTIQCAQCHNHKFDPFTHEDYYKVFACLNNDDEPNAIVYSPDERMKIAAIHRRTSRDRGEPPAHHARLVGEDGEVGGVAQEGARVEDGDGHVRRGFHGRPEVQARARRLVLRLRIRADEAHRDSPATTDLKTIGAFRIELMNDSNLPANGPGRSFKGTCALTEFKVEAAPADEPAKKQAVKFAKAASDFEQPEAVLEPNFDDKSGKKRITGPAAFAIDGKEETAWGIDAGPGRRNVEREAIFVPEKPLEFPKGAILTFSLKQNHGGWNSDDWMSNNLGRFRLSVAETAPDVSVAKLPKAVRDVLAVSPDKRTPACRWPPSSPTGGRPCPIGRRRTTRSTGCGVITRTGRPHWS